MSTQQGAIVDKLLTNVSNKIVPKGYISEMILPQLNVVQYSGLIGNYGNDHLRIVNTVSGGKQGYPMVESDVRSSTGYYVETHGLKDIITKRDFANVEKPFDARRDVTAKLTTHLWLGKEFSLAQSLTDPAVITNGVTLSGTSQYNDYTNSDPIGDSNDAFDSIYNATGTEPDTLIMSRATFRTLKYHPKILDALGYKEQRPGGLSEQELADALDIDRVLVGRAVYNAGKQGLADNIQPVWPKDMIYCVAPARAELEQISLGYRVQISGQSPRQVMREAQNEPMGSEKVIIEDEYDQVLVNTDAAYLIQDAIA